MFRTCAALAAGLVALAALFSPGLPLRAAEAQWTADFDAAKAAADRDGKDLLLVFFASQRHEPSAALTSKVLHNEAFQDEMGKHAALVKLDLFADPRKPPQQEVQRSRSLSGQYGIADVPSLVLADAQGRPYGMIAGYKGIDAAAMLERLAAARENRKRRDAFLAKAVAAEGVAKARLLAAAISEKTLPGFTIEMALTHYTDVIRQIVALDAENTAKRKENYGPLLRRYDTYSSRRPGRLRGILPAFSRCRTAGRKR